MKDSVLSDAEEKKRLKKEKKKEKKLKKEKKKEKKLKKEKKSSKRKDRGDDGEDQPFVGDGDCSVQTPCHKKLKCSASEHRNDVDADRISSSLVASDVSVPVPVPIHMSRKKNMKITFPIKYILAPMVGASELPFRILCRKYGTQTAYTPMMNSHKFATDAKYREDEFQTIPEDRPLVCHFSSNDPKDFVSAAKLVQHQCDAIDLNLGCPQRTAYLGHFGSYLLEPKDRQLICSIVRAAAEQISVPIFVKIRLLDTIDETIQLCRQLKDAGASLITIHARYRASFERKGPGARDGPAMLDQVLKVKQALMGGNKNVDDNNDGDGGDFALITNGNIITYTDVVNNLNFTQAHGCMSAEGILDDPALYLPQLGSVDEDGEKIIHVPIPSPLPNSNSSKSSVSESCHGPQYKKKRKLIKKLREIEKIEKKALNSNGERALFKEEKDKIALKKGLQKELLEIEKIEAQQQKIQEQNQPKPTDNGDPSTLLPGSSNNELTSSHLKVTPKYEKIPLHQLHKTANDKLSLAVEYLDLTRQYPTKLRTVVFHTRRMLKQLLNRYQLMEECISSKSVGDILNVIQKMRKYEKDPTLFVFDKEKQQKEKEAMERKRREEGKRKAYEARMIRKAKREGKDDLEYYLRQGAKVPTVTVVEKLKKLSKEDQMQCWKDNDHSQHCLAFHLGCCKRDRSCAFLHADALGENSFQEMDEVAG